jgi:hypothetical protein
MANGNTIKNINNNAVISNQPHPGKELPLEIGVTVGVGVIVTRGFVPQ